MFFFRLLQTIYVGHAVPLHKRPCAVPTRPRWPAPLVAQELLGQCGHYSEKVRREALAGLAELLAAHPAELGRHATLVMETLAGG